MVLRMPTVYFVVVRRVFRRRQGFVGQGSIGTTRTTKGGAFHGSATNLMLSIKGGLPAPALTLLTTVGNVLTYIDGGLPDGGQAMPQAHLMRSSDGGNTWTASSGSDAGRLPNVPINKLLVSLRDPSGQTLYAATWQRTRRKWSDPRTEPGSSESGISKTTDGGRTWTGLVGTPSVMAPMRSWCRPARRSRTRRIRPVTFRLKRCGRPTTA